MNVNVVERTIDLIDDDSTPVNSRTPLRDSELLVSKHEDSAGVTESLKNESVNTNEGDIAVVNTLLSNEDRFSINLVDASCRIYKTTRILKKTRTLTRSLWPSASILSSFKHENSSKWQAVRSRWPNF